MRKYIYTRLSKVDFSIFRLGGPGLANCMFFASRSVVLANKYGATMLRPTWERFGVGAFLRKEMDLRHYRGLFRQDSLLKRIKKLFLLMFARRHSERNIELCNSGIIVVDGWVGFNGQLAEHYEEVKEYFDKEMLPTAIRAVPSSLKGFVAVHIRLGDMPSGFRVPLDWYIEKINQVAAQALGNLEFLIFSDGTDAEIQDVLKLKHTKRVFYGNALADMIAISRCDIVIGSVSTFSWWGAYFGQVPCIFDRNHSGCMLKDKAMMVISRMGEPIPSDFVAKALTRQ